MESVGMPVDVQAIKNFMAYANQALRDVQEDVNRRSGMEIFRQTHKKNPLLSMDNLKLRDWIKANVPDYKKTWGETDGGDISLSSDDWDSHFSIRSPYPDTIPGQLIRWFRFKQSMSGLIPPAPTAKDKTTILDKIGADGCVRPYMGIYGAQSGRSQPGAKYFLYLKSKVFRALLRPPEGKVIFGADFSAQEVLIAACISGDKVMEKAYDANDYYCAVGEGLGLMPAGATKATHPAERSVVKALALGLSYLKGPRALAKDLACSEGRAEELVDAYWNNFCAYSDYVDEGIRAYREDGYIELPYDGWAMLGSNDNFRSVANVRVQGAGASVMRLAVKLLIQNGFEVSATVHDELVVLLDVSSWTAQADRMCEIMNEAFKAICGRDIKMGAYAFGPAFGDRDYSAKVTTPAGRIIDVSGCCIEEGAEKDFEKFRPVFWPEEDWRNWLD
jgi:hypothetical protein